MCFLRLLEAESGHHRFYVREVGAGNEKARPNVSGNSQFAINCIIIMNSLSIGQVAH